MTHRFFSLLAKLSLITGLALFQAAANAQLPVDYGGYVSAAISSAGQTVTYYFQGAAGDALLVNFNSQYFGYPTNQYAHRLEVRQGATTIGTGIDGHGTMTAVLPGTGFYTIHVRARNNQFTGSYAFMLNRVNAPVGADAQGFGWTGEGAIQAQAEARFFTIHGDQDSSAQLQFTSQYLGYPTNQYTNRCELRAGDGTVLAAVDGNGTSSAFTFPETGEYTLFVRARNHAFAGWFSASVQCLEFPTCDMYAHAANYGVGTPGSYGTPTLTALTLPQLGTAVQLDIGNCAGQDTVGWFMIGFDRDWSYLPAFDARLLVNVATVLEVAPMPTGGLLAAIPLPPATASGAIVLTGVTIAAQAVVQDPAATGGWAFTPGLMLKLGM